MRGDRFLCSFRKRNLFRLLHHRDALPVYCQLKDLPMMAKRGAAFGQPSGKSGIIGQTKQRRPRPTDAERQGAAFPCGRLHRVGFRDQRIALGLVQPVPQGAAEQVMVAAGQRPHQYRGTGGIVYRVGKWDGSGQDPPRGMGAQFKIRHCRHPP